MNEEYLWDRSGPPDPEIERLEKTLAPLRYRHRAGVVRLSSPRPRLAWAAAAASILCTIAVWQFRFHPSPVTGWQVSNVEGAARLGNSNAQLDMSLRSGQSV